MKSPEAILDPDENAADLDDTVLDDPGALQGPSRGIPTSPFFTYWRAWPQSRDALGREVYTDPHTGVRYVETLDGPTLIDRLRALRRRVSAEEFQAFLAGSGITISAWVLREPYQSYPSKSGSIVEVRKRGGTVFLP